MKYLSEFTLASDKAETEYILDPGHRHYKVDMTCYSDSFYPFRMFPEKGLHRITFDDVTIFCGGNGSGKSTLLSVIAGKLGLKRSAPFNDTPLFEDYLTLCDYELKIGRKPPEKSAIITSDDVFDYLLNIRTLNRGVDVERERLFDEYYVTKKIDQNFKLRSLDDYDELKRRNEIKHSTMSAYTGRRLPKNIVTQSNGESAFRYFTTTIDSDAIYLLDEPENSLSAKLQLELRRFIIDSVRFYNCQFIISTHSPFLLSLGREREIGCAKIYNLDAEPVTECDWLELDAVKIYRDLFE